MPAVCTRATLAATALSSSDAPPNPRSSTPHSQEAQGEHESKSQRRYENLALLQAQLEHEQVEQAQREKIESLKSHLASVIERTSRIRNAYEKEKKHLAGQVRRFSA